MQMKIDKNFSMQQNDRVIQKLKKEVYSNKRNKTVVNPKINKGPSKNGGCMSIGETRTFLHIRDDNSLNSIKQF
jgi:hypothetical protein